MRNMFDLSGQKILVTGAGGAIGGAAARACAALGADLVLADLFSPEALAQEIRASNTCLSAHALDNTVRASVDALVEATGPFDALADCSGYYVRGAWDSDVEDWEAIYRRTLDVNMLGPINLIRAVLPAMRARGSGRIALVGSAAGRNAGSTLAIEPAYVASKGGLHALVRYFARQVAPDGIVVNAIAPGPVITPLSARSGQPFDPSNYPMKRIGEPDEIGWPIAFLCTRATGFMTGAVVDVNGGMAFS
jgi:NAD(P)-dependent dehydrogenase (short-subunit alcohol dehydrogenase family)